MMRYRFECTAKGLNLRPFFEVEVLADNLKKAERKAKILANNYGYSHIKLIALEEIPISRGYDKDVEI